MEYKHSYKYYPTKQNTGFWMPPWLGKIPTACLSITAKFIYGRLAMISHPKGIAEAMTTDLGDDLGVTTRQAQRGLEELLYVGLLERDPPKRGKPKVYRFPLHPWMHGHY